MEELKTIYYSACIVFLLLVACNNVQDKKEQAMNKNGYSDVNGIKMYYEIYGKGAPLILIHGGGSTIQSTFGRLIPLLDKNYRLIAMELQNHGRSGQRDVPETFEQDADDVSTLLKNLGIGKASFLGFSNGGQTALQVAIRHPEMVDKLIVISSPVKRSGFIPGFFDGMTHASLGNMPPLLKTEFLKVNPDSNKLQHMFEKDRDRMMNFKDFPDEQLKGIMAPTLLINGDADVITAEHAVEMHRLIPHSSLAILPGGHGDCIGEVTTLKNDGKDSIYIVPMIEEFLAK